MVATLYLTQPASPEGTTWVHVYEILSHTVAGIKVRDGRNTDAFYPAHMIQRVEYK